MRPSSSIIKSYAREIMLGHYGSAITALLLLELITALPSMLFIYAGVSSPAIAIASTIIIALLSVVLRVGYHYLFLQTARNRDFVVSDIFFSFNNHPDTVILLTLVMAAIGLAASIPFVCVAYYLTGSLPITYSMSAGVLEIIVPVSLTSSAFLAWCIDILLWAVVLLLIILYSIPAFLIYLDHTAWSVKEILQEYLRLMHGNKLRYLWLQISFIGFGLLNILSLGIGALWSLPYYNTSLALFYLDLVTEEKA